MCMYLYRDISNPSLHLMTLLKAPTAKTVYLSSSMCSLCRSVPHESLTRHYTRPVRSEADMLQSQAWQIVRAAGINRHAFIKVFFKLDRDRIEMSKLAVQNKMLLSKRK